ncbi:MAG: DUF5790 family protein [Haloferacaceae archaeon]
MSQSTLGDEDLFGEAADEMRADVEHHLGEARADLPDAAAVWETDADNVLGVLNGLGAALDVGEAEEHLRQAKKWYAVGERADAFEDADDLAEAIESVESVVDLVTTAGEQVADLTNTVPELRSALQEFEAEADADADADADEDEE